MLATEGKLSFDDKITKYFTHAPSSWTNVTVRHLLTHTAGFTDYPRDFDLRRDYTEDELLERIAMQKQTLNVQRPTSTIERSEKW
jgi:CubicO group peptidase (beta-lactamase class C family)